MKKIAFIVHRYGEEIVGGAEYYVKTLSEHLVSEYDVTVLTTTSIDYITWSNHWENGETLINGVKVIRFSPIVQRNMQEFSQLCNRLEVKINSGEKTNIREDMEWILAQGPVCPDLVEYIKNKKNEYDVFIVVTYIYYTAVMTIPEMADKLLFIPTAHDETWIRLGIFEKIFQFPRYYGFLTEEEQKFVQGFFKNDYIPSSIIGTGIETPTQTNNMRFRDKYNINKDYLIYVGRIDASKGCGELVDYFLKYKKKYKTDIKLIMVGKGEMEIEDHNDIITTGYVTDEEKQDAIAGAMAMVTPSRYESLCIALLESLAMGVPVIANAKCTVLKGQCLRSNAGLYYDNEFEFGEIINYLSTHQEVYNGMRKNGLQYIEERYSWSAVIQKMRNIIAEIIKEKALESKGQKVEFNTANYKLYANNKSMVEPIFEEAITIVTAADNNYADFAGITINSIIINANPVDNYDIVILTNNITDEKIRDILTLIQGRSNFSIRFLYVNSIMEQLDIKVSDNYKIVTYYRLLLQQLMQKYSKVLYVDSDIIINSNIKELWSVDIEGYFIGATYDMLISAWQNYDSGMQAYFEALGINNPGKYIQAGVILFNIYELNKNFDKNLLIQKACRERYIFADQDLLNILCKGRIKYFDLAWDVLNLSDEGYNLCDNYLPEDLREEFYSALDNPKIIHYTEQSFPCWKFDRKFSELYWKYSKKTVFFDDLCSKKNKKLLEELNLELKNIKEKSKEIEPIQINFKSIIRDLLTVSAIGKKILLKYRHKIVKSDMKQLLKINGNVEVGKEYVIHKDGSIFGPNIFGGKGLHCLIINVKMKENVKRSVCRIVAGARHIKIKNFDLKNGKNIFNFHLDRNYVDVEMILSNDDDDVIIVKDFKFI